MGVMDRIEKALNDLYFACRYYEGQAETDLAKKAIRDIKLQIDVWRYAIRMENKR